MGLSNALSGGIIMFGITWVIFIFGGLTDDAASVTDTSTKVSNLENKILKTSINVDISSPPGTDATFDFQITNTNSEKLWDFENFDVLITFDPTGSGGITTVSQTYDSTCPPVVGQWCISSWTGDVLDPKILNYGETITIRTEVSSGLQNNSDLIVIVSTPNGVVSKDTIVV